MADDTQLAPQSAINRKYFDACIYTNAAGREQLRVAALIVVKAVLGYDQDQVRRRDALMYQQNLASGIGELDLCVAVRNVWGLGTMSGIVVPEIRPAMDQLEQVAKNVYEGKGGGFPFMALLAIAGIGIGGFFVYRSVTREQRIGRQG